MEFFKRVVWFCSLLTLFSSLVSADTDPRDVTAMNSLCVSLNLPPLQGWKPVGGDPCGEQWQGVSCVFSNITALKLNGMNLGGTLDIGIEQFESILEIDLSNNHIGGSIPIVLPPTLRNFSLAGNQFNGSVPSTLSSLTQLVDLSLNNNFLSGGIPDSFQQLISLVNLDLSWNNLSDLLPPSMGSLLSLSSLQLQNNKLIGTLDVLQDLPLQDLNVENNLFSGPIPSKLSAIPNFRKDGNPFNTTILPSPPAPLPPQVSSPSPSSTAQPPWISGFGPSYPEKQKPPEGQKKEAFTSNTKKVVIAAAGTTAVILLGLCVCLPIYCKRKNARRDPEDAEFGGFNDDKSQNKASLKVYHEELGAPKGLVTKLDEQKGPESSPKTQDEQVASDQKRMASSSTGASLKQCPPPPGNKVTVNDENQMNKDLSSAGVFTIATLQQYTNSFAEENYVGEGSLSRVYKAELSDGKLVAVKKLNATASGQITDEKFLHLVSAISRINHPNIVEFAGYCIEHGHKLLVYEYCENGTLHDALHLDEEIHGKLSWNKRVRLALGAARALQYLHEVCQPPVVHQNFKSANILLDFQLVAKVSDSGLGSLKSSSSTSVGFSGRHNINSQQGYTAPELDSGSHYSSKSDVYSFGIVMLELLTGRKSYDSSRARGEQYLVRWAISQLHDIDSLSRMVDPSLDGSYPAKSLSRFADIISRCIQSEPEFRPAMSEVVQDLLQMI
ncbi:unnamed protein product [Linum tenue]|uniref:Protein kinase domain-containing protein n=1 Tax=Linum tenue TaxID=586396 RepID=A0AAV0JCE2_9ROSI|nr:unnamed protein product [Linum tenue]